MERAASRDGVGQRAQKLVGAIPRHAGIGDGLTVHQLIERGRLLMASHQEAFHHHTGDALFAGRQTFGNLFDDPGFTILILAAVAMGGINDEAMLAGAGRLGCLQILERLTHGCGIIVRTMAGAAQHQMAVRVTFGLGGNHTAIKIDG